VSAILTVLAPLSMAMAGDQTAEQPLRRSWSADNGNGTYTNPLFYDEFSDPDLIRVGSDYYMTGTTMHSIPGLPVLHSRDLVNWEFLSYAASSLDLGPEYRLEGGEVYGQGLWAPTFRYHDGTYYIFSNVNRQKTQKFTATDPRGPWTHEEMNGSFHDLSLLFDDDGKVYMVWGYQTIQMAELNATLTDIVPGTEQTILEEGSGLGEGIHFYKFDDQYFLISAEYRDSMRMPTARASSPYGPWEIKRAISEGEDFGLMKGRGINAEPFLTGVEPPFDLTGPDPASRNRLSLHQGGVVQTVEGEWWGFSMYDANSIGRLTALSPVTWEDGWPMFGLPGNLGRSPRTWTKPAINAVSHPKAPYKRSDDFSRSSLQPIWQWNHMPQSELWSLENRPGYLSLKADPAATLLESRSTLTQRTIGPRSSATTLLDGADLGDGDLAGLAMFGRPYAWIGLEKKGGEFSLHVNSEQSPERTSIAIETGRVWLKVDCDFITEDAQFSYSVDGQNFKPLGGPHPMVYQLYTFQGIRYSLFAFNEDGQSGGWAEFDYFDVTEPEPYGLAPIPYGHAIQLSPAMSGDPIPSELAEPLRVVDKGLGRVSLERDGKALTVLSSGQVVFSPVQDGESQSFQWSETPSGEIILMSLVTNRYLRIDTDAKLLRADSPGPEPDGLDGVRFQWK